MKKLAIATIIALTVGSASALEVGVNTARDFAGQDQNGFGVTVGDKAGRLGGAVGFQRFDRGDVLNDYDRYSLTGSYDVAKFGPATVAVKAGGVYLQPSVGQSGYALAVGAGVSVPVTKAVSVGVDLTRQYGQDRVSQFDGNMLTAGLKFTFK